VLTEAKLEVVVEMDLTELGREIGAVGLLTLSGDETTGTTGVISGVATGMAREPVRTGTVSPGTLPGTVGMFVAGTRVPGVTCRVGVETGM